MVLFSRDEYDWLKVIASPFQLYTNPKWLLKPLSCAKLTIKSDLVSELYSNSIAYAPKSTKSVNCQRDSMLT